MIIELQKAAKFLENIKKKIKILYFRVNHCIENFLNWKDIICLDYQYNNLSLLLILRKKLSLIEKVWGVSSNHEKDYEEKTVVGVTRRHYGY